MIQPVEIPPEPSLSTYEQYVSLNLALHHFEAESREWVPELKGRKIWMVNSTATGGGVAEMMPTMISLMRQVGLDAEWVVMGTDEEPFFNLTKNLHNLIHGEGHLGITEEERQMYERINHENAAEMADMVSDGDLVVIHDPQPMAMAGRLRQLKDIKTVWRCHIGLDQNNDQTQEAWKFLGKYFPDYDRFVFSAPE